jgi:hypothetical protein
MSTDKQKLEPFQTRILTKFQFGDPDAKADDLLLSCPQMIRGVNEFLGGSKNIVLGERGAGKSALFRLVVEGKYKFSTDPNEKVRRQIILGIDDDLNYVAISNVIEARFVDNTKRRHGKYKFLWEIYVLSRVIEKLGDEFGEDEEIKTLQADFGVVLGVSKEKKFRLSDLWTSYKVTTGIKVEQTGAISPTVSLEPAKDAHTAESEVTDHQLAQFRDRVRKAIRARKSVVYVLVDKIDDFVVDLAYEEQKKSVQALLECTQALRFPELKLKIFLRPDIFKRLDFEKGGYDKISPQVVRLQWTASDIYEFCARRLLYNYERLQIKTPPWGISLQMLDVDPSLRQKARDLLAQHPTNIGGIIRQIGSVLYTISKIKWSLLRKKSHSERKTNSLDERLSKVVNFIFPTRSYHYNINCKREEILFRAFLADHFQLGGENPNPRLVLLFLHYTFEEAIAYYERNPDRRLLQANDAQEYELILREHILRGYSRLQETARETVVQLSQQWRPVVATLLAGLTVPRECSGLSMAQITKLAGWSGDEADFRRFVAFYSHIGMLVLDNESAKFEDRRYSLPTVMRICPVATAPRLT